MSEKLDEFKQFVKRHPLLKQEVLAKRKTWQQLYEEYVILGEDEFSSYTKEDNTEEVKDDVKTVKTTKNDSATEDLIKNIVGYVKKIDPDQITKTVTSIQKVIELFSSFGAGAATSALAKKSTGDPLFDKRFDEWY